MYISCVDPLKFGYIQSFKAIAVFQMVSHGFLACLISKLCCNRHDMSDSGGLQHVLVCLFFKLHCRRHDMSDAGELQHVLACLFCSLNCKRWRQVTSGSEAADRLATSQAKRRTQCLACKGNGWYLVIFTMKIWQKICHVECQIECQSVTKCINAMVGITRSKSIVYLIFC